MSVFSVGGDVAVLCDNDQTITGNKTFTTNPIMSGINNGAFTINVPSTNGTFAVAPSSSVSGDLLSFSNSTGGIQDSGVNLTNLLTNSSTATLTNKTINNLTCTGTSQSLLSGKEQAFYFSGITTVGATSANIATIPISSNSNVIIKVKCFAFCTASSGADLNKIRTIENYYTTKNLVGNLTNFVINSIVGGDLLFLPSLNQSSTGANSILSVTGVLGDTISYSGIYYVTSQ
jgi:hypothetical protein